MFRLASYSDRVGVTSLYRLQDTHLAETDGTPNRLCSECRAKLYWTCCYDARKRLLALHAFFQTHQLKHDALLAGRDLKRRPALTQP